MTLETKIEPFVTTDNVSHLELAFVNFDQWLLIVALRVYTNPHQRVEGMIHVIFENIVGFRVLDEGQMLNFPWKSLDSNDHFVHEVPHGGWMEIESKSNNICLSGDPKEYVIITSNECVSVIAYDPPVPPASINRSLAQQTKYD